MNPCLVAKYIQYGKANSKNNYRKLQYSIGITTIVLVARQNYSVHSSGGMPKVAGSSASLKNFVETREKSELDDGTVVGNILRRDKERRKSRVKNVFDSILRRLVN